MATKARQQYHADEVTLSKDRREFSISDDVQEKIEGIEDGAQVNTIETIRVNGNEVQPDENKAIDLTIPGVIDSLSSTSITDALSARQGKILYDKIDNVSRIGHFLALWDASTGLPVTDPETSPYEYHAGDFYIISVVAAEGGTNYKPSGTEYISGQASTDVEVDDIAINDFYFYDGTYRRHMANSGTGGSVVVDSSLSTTSRNPVENRVITNALSGKQNTLTAGANIQISGNTISATDTKYTAGTGISIVNGVISNTQTSAEWGNITGTLSDQTDLQTVLTSKATDADVVHKTGAETIGGTKTFSTSPVVPSKTTAATNTGTAIATEAQVYKKQDTLVSGTNIKTINSNSLLGSGDISITGFSPSNTGSTGNVLTKTATGYNWAAPASQVSDTTYGTSWNGVTATAPSQNAVYDKISAMDTTISGKANDSDVVKLTGNQTIAGAKTFSTSPVVPSKTTDATNTGTAIATEAQVYKKQDTLVSGTNIKTINGTSILGSGDITISSPTYTAGEGINIDANNEISLNAEFMTQSAYDNITPESGKYYLIYEHRYPDISISVSSNYEGQTPGKDDEVQFTVRVTNDGDNTITINVESQLTEDYYSDTFNQGQTREYELSWIVNDINIKDGNFVFDVTASEEDNPENTITYTKTIMTEPIQYPTLSIQITPSQQSAGLGDNVDFDISVTNNLYYIDEVIISSIYSERNRAMAGGETYNFQDDRTVAEDDVARGSFTFTVTAQEDGNPQNTATASVTIPVTS